jgi:desulfoferrodoxin (superoxide reductase-like protein)
MSDRAQNRREFLAQSSVIATAAALPAAITGCSEDDPPEVQVNLEWEDTADGLEQSPKCCWTGAADEIAKGSPSVGAHLPQISIDTSDSGVLRATVFTLGDEDGSGQAKPHPMTEAHWLTVMYVRNQDNVVVYLRDFGQEAIKVQYLDDDPRFIFDVPPGTRWLRAFSFCNLHQHWRGPRVDIEEA